MHIWIGVVVLFITSSFAQSMYINEENPGLEAVIDADQWNMAELAALRKMLIQEEFQDRYPYERPSRSFPSPLEAGARGWMYPRSVVGPRLTKQDNTDKRQGQQARFRQCYFNPISCFRK